MSLRRGNRRENEIELDAVIHFLRVILCMAAGITVLTVIGLLGAMTAGMDLILYQLTLLVDGILFCGGMLGMRILNNRARRLKEREEVNAG